MRDKIPVVAAREVSVFLSGETGTGKELFARALHHLSPRASEPFIPVNCGAIPVDLIENEMFGHASEAYTDARTSKTGLIHEADQGTLFLDEINSLPAMAQVKLLRFLQEKEYRPLGSAKTLGAEVRIISAMNADVEKELNSGRLRRELYYRLNVVSLELPPLRERREDIVPLARHFHQKYTVEFELPDGDFSQGALDKLLQHDWPGNVRELENVVQRALALSDGGITGRVDIDLPEVDDSRRTLSFKEAKAESIRRFEVSYLTESLRACNGNIAHAAVRAQKNRRAFWELIRKHEIDVASLRP